MNELENARKEINEVDAEMAKLFEKRMKAVGKIAEYKAKHGLSVLDEDREKAVIKNNSEYISDDVVREYYVEFLQSEMAVSRKYQSRLSEGIKVAYCGIKGAYAHIAAKKMFPECIPVSFADFAAAYKAVEDGDCDVAVLPTENSYAGDVGTVMDLIFSGSLFVNQVIDLSIKHDLLSVKGATKDSVKKVISHAQALSQCAAYISEKGYLTEETSNTAVAAEYVKEKNDPSLAAIASKDAAEIYGLEVLESGVNTSAGNTTRFAAFSRAMHTPSAGRGKMNENFILTFTVKNEAGALAKTLDIIGAHGFNMRNLRSRPMKALLWSYYFYIEAEGNINTENGRDMLKELGATCDKLKLVGTYVSNDAKQ